MERKIIIASEGKIFRRKADCRLMGKKIVLGYSFYANNQKLINPHLDTPADFEEVDEPENWGIVKGGKL